MKATDIAGVLIPIKVTDAKGRVIPNFHPTTPDRTIKGSFQPLQSNVNYNAFGITDKTKNVFYCTDFNLNAEMHLIINDNQYLINDITTWKKHVEVFLELVILNE